MKRKSLPTVTVGIPAHNESENIYNLLASIVKQDQTNFVQERIIVICDGCTDQTPEVTKKFKAVYPVVEMVNDGKRLGKAGRLNEIYSLSKSDYLITLDADVSIFDRHLIQKLLEPFDLSPQILVVAANGRPCPPRGTVEYLVYCTQNVWYNIRCDYNNGVNIYNCAGCGVAVRSSFYRHNKFPTGLIADQQYVYLMAQKRRGFCFASDAVVYYKLPASVSDYFTQISRAVWETLQIKELLNEDINGEYRIPRRYMLSKILESFLARPLETMVGGVGISLSKLIKQFLHGQRNKAINGLWDPILSTKKPLCPAA